MDGLLPRLRLDLPAGDDRLDPATSFDRPLDDLWLEIGFGGGEHTAHQAKANPRIGVIACEAFVNGIASLLAHLERESLRNVRIYPEDGRRLLARLPDACLGRVFVLFPDPWPKKRHAERRLIGPATLQALARCMKDGAELRVASDQMFYIRWTLEHACSHPAFAWTAREPADWRTRPADAIETRYEAKARAKGLTPAYLTFRRRNRDPALLQSP